MAKSLEGPPAEIGGNQEARLLQCLTCGAGGQALKKPGFSRHKNPPADPTWSPRLRPVYLTCW